MSWKRMKGLEKATNQCPRCHGEFTDDEYDSEEDLCLFCLFPETSGAAAPLINYDYGFPRNITPERYVLDNLDRIDEKQSKRAQKEREAYKNRKLYK
jgi:hypothetical protein